MSYVWNYIWTILASTVASATVTTGILLLAKTWMSERIKQSIQYEYATRLELHKATFKAEFDVKVAEYQAAMGLENSQILERLKADLAIAAAQRQMVHKGIYEREAEAISETYENISDVLTTCAAYVSIVEIPSMGSKADRRVSLNRALEKFRSRFRLQRLYLPRVLADSVDSFARELLRRATAFALRVDHDAHSHEASEYWMKVDEYMEKEAPALFEQLEREFRLRLGQDESVGAVRAAERK
jgi:hypothetical protein